MRTNASFLADTFRRKLKGKIAKGTKLDELVDTLMDEVPQEAFDAPVPFDRGIVLLCDDVDATSASETIAHLLAAHLSMKPEKKIVLYLSSCGGEVGAGLSIVSTIHAIRRSGRVVNTHIQGSAFSMASYIAQAGTQRIIESYGTMMLHDLSWSLWSSRKDGHEDAMSGAERETDALVSLYEHRTGKPKSFWREAIHRRDWYLSAQEALNLNLVDEILAIP